MQVSVTLRPTSAIRKDDSQSFSRGNKVVGRKEFGPKPTLLEENKERCKREQSVGKEDALQL